MYQSATMKTAQQDLEEMDRGRERTDRQKSKCEREYAVTDADTWCENVMRKRKGHVGRLTWILCSSCVGEGG